MVIAAILVGLTNFGIGVLLCFIGAYVFTRPDGKFTGDGLFRLGVMASGWMSLCLMISFLVAAPLYLRAFGKRTWRHLIAYSAAFLVGVTLILNSPPGNSIAAVLWRITSAIIPNEIAQVIIPTMGATVIASVLFSAFVFLVTIPFRAKVAGAANRKSESANKTL